MFDPRDRRVVCLFRKGAKQPTYKSTPMDSAAAERLAVKLRVMIADHKWEHEIRILNTRQAI